MRDDLKGLAINQKELQKLTNLPINEELIILVNPLKLLIGQFIHRVRGPEGATAIFIGLAAILSSYIVFDLVLKMFGNLLQLPSWLLFIKVCFFGGAITQLILYFTWKKRVSTVKENLTHCLNTLLHEVDRFNAVVKAIDINDKIEAAGNTEVIIKERKRVIEALKYTRADLVRALKTERILRENKRFIVNNSELLANNLATLTQMQVSERASEHGRLLNEALEIAMDVQQEMKRLQSH
ncbi:hypothetical protein Riv7116_2305 [Rivularia sp. PCC 7116]|uniref:hypothetical protein n=1 Tax=Rivularia sp. PCC 7116 TaxID=373994 RepID=UPI00029F228E|nr:hypothetical protein [Rivularia sp. PCC 7116]AFY54823.1 hypothetical protein Riv7116_2305 [Rivularia sp. PCC 7116]